MSIADQKRIIRLTESFPEDHAFVPTELDRRMREMDAGKFMTMEQLLAAHGRLKTKRR